VGPHRFSFRRARRSNRIPRNGDGAGLSSSRPATSASRSRRPSPPLLEPHVPVSQRACRWRENSRGLQLLFDILQFVRRERADFTARGWPDRERAAASRAHPGRSRRRARWMRRTRSSACRIKAIAVGKPLAQRGACAARAAACRRPPSRRLTRPVSGFKGSHAPRA
jgi:hypothetical protein